MKRAVGKWVGPAGLTRFVCLVAVLAAVGLLPWLSGRDPALTVLRARSAEQEATPEALAAIREDLGLGAGPLSLLGDWASDCCVAISAPRGCRARTCCPRWSPASRSPSA